MKRFLQHVWDKGREYVGHWMVAGIIVAATGVAPDHWMAHLVQVLHLPADALHLWAAGIDPRWVLLGAGLALVVGDITWRRMRPLAAPPAPAPIADAPPLPDKPSIAVLPFDNLSGDPSQEYFSDGVAEDIITELSRSRALFVIARNSSFTYKGRLVDVKQVAHELGVRYVLEGSLRRDGERVRLSAQLIDAETGNHVWAERYDRDLTDVFAVQDEITQAVAGAITPAISQAERRRSLQKAPENLGAWEAYQRGLWHLSKGSAADDDLGREFLQRAVALEPRFADAHAKLAWFYIHSNLSETMRGGTRPFEAGVKLAEAAARAALEIDADNAGAHAALAYVFSHRGDAASALEQAEHAIALNPNDPEGYVAKGHVLVFSGGNTQAQEALAICLRLDPLGPMAPLAMHTRATGNFLARAYEAAEAAARRAILTRPDFPRPYTILAATLGQLGRGEEAREALRQAIAATPAYFEFLVRHRPPWYRPADHDHFVEGLRKAGWQG
jgi:TolB-like protein